MQSEEREMSAANKALIEHIIENVWNRVEDDEVDRLVAEEYVGHPSGVLGTEAYKRFYRELHSASPDITFTVEDQIAEGDKVTTRWTARGTHLGNYAGLPPSGRTFEFGGTSTHRIQAAKVVECWTNMDEAGLFRQIAPPAAALAG
jgi:steroid delta-isomerase-like uncharacterized protein